jgi:hypothetical protein
VPALAQIRAEEQSRAVAERQAQAEHSPDERPRLSHYLVRPDYPPRSERAAMSTGQAKNPPADQKQQPQGLAVPMAPAALVIAESSAQQPMPKPKPKPMKPHGPFSDPSEPSVPDLTRFDVILSPKLPLDSRPPGLPLPSHCSTAQPPT